MPVIVFRTDASLEIGSGHVMRCLTLASELKTAGAQVSFICREQPGNLCDTISGRWGCAVHRLPNTDLPAGSRRTEPGQVAHAGWLGVDWKDDATQTEAAIASRSERVDWLVVDHYALDARWETAVRPSAGKLIVIDDLADREHDCDLLLDQNLTRDLAGRYDDLIPSHCQRLLGPRYALLRPEFREARAQLRTRDGTVRRVLIFFGGIDAGNQTAKALKAVIALGKTHIGVDVIVGPANPNLDNIRTLCAELPRADLHHNPGNIAELMSNADLAVGAAGATTWERCCLGLPSIVISLAINQEPIARALADSGLAIYLGASEIVTATTIAASIEELMHSRDDMQMMGRASAELTDGNGTLRVVRALDHEPIVLRPAQTKDCESLYQWRNAEDTRRYSQHSGPIAQKQHQQWFNALMQDSQRALLIGERNRQPVGVLRYDCEKSHCTASVYLVPGQYGHGYGPRLLCAGHEWLQRHRPHIKLVRAEVLEGNRASVNAFLQAGYRRQGDMYIKHLE